MKTRTILLSALVAVGALLAGCGGGGESAEAGKGKVEVVSFQGGYGIDFFQAAGKEWGEKEGREVDVWGDPRVWEKLRPRFVAGDVPDLAWPGWGMDYWALVYDDQLKPWDEYLDQDGWRDSFDPGLLKMGMHEGKVYMLPYHVNINGWWYNADLFQANGWEVPTTFDELLALNDKIKAKGLAPITFQGQYPYYMLAGFLYPWIISHGGIEAWNDIQNLKPGAWKSASVLEAARRTQALVQRGDFLRGSMGLNHTDSQAAFYDGKAAMIPCGTWLVSEMAEYAKTMPNGAPKVEFMAVPTLP
ncbi:MAG: extracellular solute-binding protein, partial [Fimbriimonadaceae bacterium]|nr:extracellular solute-binding protein [Fimbriimonadaceae bacterium]